MFQLSEKIMLLGLDGATWSILNPWISENKLPTLGKIVDSGSIGILKSTIPCTTVPAIPSLCTGINPGKHGILSFTKSDGSPVTIKDINYPKIWSILDGFNLKSCVVGLRATYPPEKLNGVMISGSSPSEKSNYVYPEYLNKEIKFKDDEHEQKILKIREKKRNVKHRKMLVDLIIGQMERRYEIFKKLAHDNDYDLLIFWIEETDNIQHWLWEYRDSLLQFYVRLDEVLNDILSTFNDRTLFIVSDHGFSPRSTEFFFVNTWLQKEGYLRQKKYVPNRLLSSVQFFAYKNIRSTQLEKLLAYFTLLRSVRRGDSGKTAASKGCAIMKIDVPGIDRKKSAAYLYTPFGIKVNTSSNYEDVRESIIKKLCRLKNQKGENVINEVWKREEIYNGEYLSEIPDIIFLASERYEPFPALTKELFSPVGKRKVGKWAGDHTKARDGIILAHGSQIKSRLNFGAARIEDVLPTILHTMGFPIPMHVDGRVLMDIFEKDSEPANREPRFEKLSIVSKETFDMSKKEENEIKKKLKDLGYI